MEKKIYLAIPYSRYEEKSFKLANEIAADLIRKGYIVFSPISMSHPIATIGGLQGDWETWKKIDLEFIRWCDEVIVIDFDDNAVNESVGVQDELKFAQSIEKTIRYYYKENL